MELNKTFWKGVAKTAGVSLAAYGLYKRFAPTNVKRLIEGGNGG